MEELPDPTSPLSHCYQLIHFDLDVISKLAAFQSVTPSTTKSHKRRKLMPRSKDLTIDNLMYSDVSESLDNPPPVRYTEEDNEVVTLVSRHIAFSSAAEIDLVDHMGQISQLTEVSDGVYETIMDEIKLHYQSEEQLLVVKNKKIGKISPKLLLSVNMAQVSNSEPFKNEVYLLNLTNINQVKNSLSCTPAVLRLLCNINTNTVEVDISYNIKLSCDLYKNSQMEVSKNIRSVILSISEPLPTSNEPHSLQHYDKNEPVTSGLFYKAISENTEIIPKIEGDFDIPELETNLIRFQKKTVNWLLQKENVQFDFESNRCTKVPLINEATYELIQKCLNDVPFESEKLDPKLYVIMNKLCFGWRRIKLAGKTYFFNKYTAHLASRRTICRYLHNYYNETDLLSCPKYLPAQGLLSEEMGLGKTVEMTALMLMNKRSIEEINETLRIQLHTFGDVKTIIKAKTTLVIAPDSILKQWVEEIVHLAPSLAVTIYQGVGKYPKLDNNAALIAEYLRKFDVVFTTYAVISKELDYALYSSRGKNTRNAAKKRTSYEEHIEESVEQSNSPVTDTELVVQDEKALLKDYKSLFQLTMTSKPEVANYRTGESQVETDYEKALQDEINLAIRHNRVPEIYTKVDYESPLMLSQFWRVVLDEVQMVSSTISRAFQSAALIPRYHSWGVSGTPIKKNLEDLHSVLHFLKYQPFCGDIGKVSWDIITDTVHYTNDDFIKLWTGLAIRHTKSMTHDDIQLPPQSRVLLTIPFTAIEQDYYNQKLEECLAAICLDVNGNPISNDWEPSPTIMTFMRTWLMRLRQICCNPQIGNLNLGARKYKKNYAYSRTFGAIQQLKTLENLLDDMLTKAYNEIVEIEKSMISLYLDIGEFYEFIYYPQEALEYLSVGVEETERIIHRLKLILDRYIREYREQGKKLDVQFNNEEDDEDIGSIDDRGGSEIAAIKDEVLEKLEDKIKLTRVRIRNWNVILHRFYFLIASSYFQRYDAEYKDIITKFRVPEREISCPEEFKKLRNYEEGSRADDLASLVNGVPVENFLFAKKTYENEFIPESEDLTGPELEEAKIKFLELKYYDLAEATRGEILRGSIANVKKAVQARIISRGWYHDGPNTFIDDGTVLIPRNSKKFFKAIPIIQADSFSEYAIFIKIKLFVDKLNNLISELNNQAKTINAWMKNLVDILCTPLLTQDKNPVGTEYEDTIQDQDKVSCYLFVLSQVLTDRSEFVNGAENSTKIVTVKKAQEKREADLELQKVNDESFLISLSTAREEIRPRVKSSLQELVLSIKNLETGLKDEEQLDPERTQIQLELLEGLGERVRTVFDNQKLSMVLLQKELNVNCNAVFNCRIDYYKQLQQISDTVQTSDFHMSRDSLLASRISTKLSSYGQAHKHLKLKMDKSVAKFRYLRGLVGTNQDNINREDDEGLMCIICRSTITIGSLTQCGHKYCKDCLEQWLRNSHTCPMCKSIVTSSSVYNFTHHKPNLKANQMEDSRTADKDNSILYSIYKPISKDVVDEIQSMRLKNSYSSKVNMIVKQVLYLRSQNPDVQIVVFSQWQDMLYILGTAFKAADISYLGSYGTLTPDIGGGRRIKKYDSVETFKDPRNKITCFLLNAKAQASGLTLINATHIFLCEPLVNTSLELQAISRIHRIGQTKPTTVWMFAIENTVEESIVIMSTNKRLVYMKQGTPDEKASESSSSVVRSGTPATLIAKTKERNLSKAESMALMNSGGIDTLINKGMAQGESVTNFDLWSAFFSARTQGRPVELEDDSSKESLQL
ncbi:SNF2 family N-terminal domain-containing protein [Scheffersomyces xylosifermentans]|uniref:SNF2 family N-terminal domain-containing protein n=1 Tax=Scheffersomyces xylosifermentans TaxID=1304137 RepID=UPI00315DCA5D